MDEEAFARIEAVLISRLEQLGLQELVDDEPYIVHGEDGGEIRLASARHRLIGRLKAFELYMRVFEKQTFRSSLDGINELLLSMPERPDRPKQFPNSATIAIPGRIGDPEMAFDLSELPDVVDLQERLHTLIVRLLEES